MTYTSNPVEMPPVFQRMGKRSSVKAKDPYKGKEKSEPKAFEKKEAKSKKK